MRRRLLPTIVLAALTLALLGAATASTPHRLPAVALGSVLAWRVEIAAVAFIAAYVAIVAVRLSLHGLTFTHLGSRGIEIPDVLSRAAAEHEAEVAAADLGASLAAIRTTIEQFDSRLRALEHARHVVLHADPGDLA
jgi:hypothetical protein